MRGKRWLQEKNKSRGRWKGGELVVAAEGKREEVGGGRAESGSQAWDGGSVRRASTGNLRLGQTRAKWSENLHTTQWCCLEQSPDEQLLYQDYSSRIWLREIAGLGGVFKISTPLTGALAIFRGALANSKDDGVKNWSLKWSKESPHWTKANSKERNNM